MKKDWRSCRQLTVFYNLVKQLYFVVKLNMKTNSIQNVNTFRDDQLKVSSQSKVQTILVQKVQPQYVESDYRKLSYTMVSQRVRSTM